MASRTVAAIGIDLNDPIQRRFGDYELLERIGEGGMGLVYRARQASLDREVAIKLLAAGPWASSEFIERFTREAQHAARMEHPNIVTVYDVGTVDQLHFFSMRLVRGETLAIRLQRQSSFDPRDAAQLMRTVAEAVAYAHSLDVLHLDLKPGNILLDEKGTPHIADFGLARRLNRMLAVENDEVAGTPNYMAPEQTLDHQGHLSAATDIWSLGAICHELVTGQPPFLGDSTQATFDLVRRGRLHRPRRLRAQIPRDLEAIILKCLAKQPDARYQTARSLADDLGRFLDHRQVRARPLHAWQRLPRWAHREPKLALTVGLALLALLASLAAITQQWQRADSNAQSAALNAASARNLLWDLRDQTALRYSDAGLGWLAAPLLLANLREQEAHHDTARARDARERLGILENGNPQLIGISAQANASTLAFTPAGDRLALANRQAVWMIDARSGTQLWKTTLGPLPIPSGQATDRSNGDVSLRFSSDGKRLIVTLGSLTDTQRMAHETLLEAEDGRRMDPPARAADFSNALYSPNGLVALLRARTGAIEAWSTQPWHRLGNQHSALPKGTVPLLVADDGRFVMAAQRTGQLSFYDLPTLTPRAQPALSRFKAVRAWASSPHQHWLAIGDANGHVRVIDSRSGAVRTLTPQSSQAVRSLAFSDDGTWLAAATGPAGVYLWAWAQDRLLAPPFGGDPPVDHARIDRVHARTMSSSRASGGSGALWTLEPTPTGMERTPAVQLGERLSLSPRGHAADFAWNPGTGLLASVRVHGDDDPHHSASSGPSLLRLERLPQAVLKSVQGAPLQPDPLRFDGRYLVAVDAHKVRIVDAGNEAPAGASIALEQPAGFAELSAAGDRLVVSQGRLVTVYRARTGTQLNTQPIHLSHSPRRVLIRPDGRDILTTWLAPDGDGTGEVAELWNARSGKRVAGPVRLAGALLGLRYSEDSSRLLAWSADQVTVLDGADLVGDSASALSAARFRTQGRRATWVTAAFEGPALLVVLRTTQPDGQGLDRLLRYEHGHRVEVQRLRRGVVDLLPLPHSAHLVSMTASGNIDLLDADAKRTPLPEDPTGNAVRAIAVSADGLWIARALRDGVEIFASHDASRIARSRAPLPMPDQIAQLAFSPDGTRLLGRSLHNRYLVWNLKPDERPVDAIEGALALRGITGLQVPSGSSIDAAVQARLRAADPGPPTVPAPRTDAQPSPDDASMRGPAVPGPRWMRVE